jgi:osmotically-inducible protein OsmY
MARFLSPPRDRPVSSAQPIENMKLKYLFVTSLLAASSFSLFAGAPADRKIEDTAKASYNYRTVLDGKVTVKASEGTVTLTGVVADKESKSLAEDTVSNLPGVLRVDNQITLDPALKEHSDAWIAWKIRYQLLVHSNVSFSDTQIDVQKGIVTLTGTAENQAQKELTAEYAKNIDNVKSVDNQILVQVAAADAKKTVAESIDDASITTQVKYALLSHKSTSALKTSISTNEGVVSITGVAANDAEKTLVGKLAQSIRGVKSVSNDMTVKS